MEEMEILFGSNDNLATQNVVRFWISPNIVYIDQVNDSNLLFRIATLGMTEDENKPLTGFRKGFIRYTYKLEAYLALFLGGVIPWI